MTLDAAVRGLERVSDRDWQRIDREALAQAWPDAVPARGGTVDGLEAAAVSIARCCESCEVCGGASVDTDSPAGGLRAVELWVCPSPSDGAHAALRTLARAAAGTRGPVGTTGAGDGAVEGYVWTANGASFMVRTDAIETPGARVGHFRWGRCRTEDVVESWPIADGLVVGVVRADVERGAAGDATLSFAYVSTCLLQDRECRDRELDRLWPSMRARAEREQALAIHVAGEDCTGRSVAFRLDRAADGRWTGGLWSPRDR
jgi:hypothetical protein